MKRSFFQAAVTSILLYGCTTWTLTKRLEKKLDGNYTRMLRAILNKSWQQHPTRHQLYSHLPPITKTIQVRRTRHAGHYWRSRDELIRDVLLWIPTHGRAKAGRPAWTYIQQLREDTGCCPEDLPRAMNDREEWRERVRDIRATSAIWWWWWQVLYTAAVSWETRVYKNIILYFYSVTSTLVWSRSAIRERVHTYGGAVWSLNSSGNSQNTGLATNQYLKILKPSLWEDLHKTWYGFYQYLKYRSHFRDTSLNASNFHNFSKHQTCPSDLTTDSKVYESSPDNIL